jgi:hypothetical protein
LTGTYAVQGKPPRLRKPKNLVPTDLRAVHAEVVAKAVELWRQGKTHMEVCEALNRRGCRTRTGKQWRHPQQIAKLLRSFVGPERTSSIGHLAGRHPRWVEDAPRPPWHVDG